MPFLPRTMMRRMRSGVLLDLTVLMHLHRRRGARRSRGRGRGGERSERGLDSREGGTNTLRAAGDVRFLSACLCLSQYTTSNKV